jgi:hypothetical protein
MSGKSNFPTILERQKMNNIISQYGPSVLAAMVGGILSLLGSLGATSYAMSKAAKDRKEAEKQEEANLAISTFSILLDHYNYVANLNRYIELCFREAEEEGDSNLEPWSKVKVAVGMELDLPKIYTKDIAFLLAANNFDLFTKILLMQRRTETINFSAREYNTLRREIHKFYEMHMTETEMTAGTTIVSTFEGRAAAMFSVRVAEIQSLLGHLMHSIEQDLEGHWETINEFRSAAKDYFGDKFLDLNIERTK